MFCSKCGNQIKDGAKFCTFCGQPVRSLPVQPKPEEPAQEAPKMMEYSETESSKPVQQNVGQAASDANYNTNADYDGNGVYNVQQPKRKKSKVVILLVILLIVLVMAIVGIVLYIFVFPKFTDNSDRMDSAAIEEDTDEDTGDEGEENEIAEDDSDQKETEPVETDTAEETAGEEPAEEEIDYLADAQEAYNSGDYANSLQYCEMALQEDTYNEAAYSLKSDIYLEQKEIEQAAEALNEGIINTASSVLETKKQQLTESVVVLSCSQYNSLGTLICNMDYDAKGNPIRYTFYDESGNISAVEECNYDVQGLMTGMSHYNGSSSLEWKENYSYDSAGYRIGCIRYNGKNKKEWTEEYQNDAYGRHIEVARYNANGSLSWRDEYFYDSDENFVKSAHPSPNSTVRYQCAYVYDQFGNQTEFTEYNENGECTNSWKKEYNSLGLLSKYNYADHEVNYVYEYSIR